MKKNVAIEVSNVSKDFFLPHEKSSYSIKSSIVNVFRRRDKRGGNTQHALKGLSFEVKKGDFFGIVGRNGSGKSTLLKILASIYQPTKGSVSTDGRLVPFIELGVGFNPELTGRENVYLNGALLGFSRLEIDKIYDDIVDFAELHRFMDQKLKNYSSGMQVRLAFSVATHAQADILLVDEVLAVGDADFQRKCFAYFKKLKRNHQTIIFVSHDMNAVREYCNKAILIENGEITHSGKPDTVAQEYLKLFVTNETKAVPTRKKSRWGNGGVRISDFSIEKTRITEKDQVISFSYKVSPTAPYKQDIIFGYSIKDPAGNPLCGSNSKQQRLPVTTLESDPVKIEWQIDNIFSSGNYTIDVAVALDTGEILEWWNGAKEFSVSNEFSTQSAVSPRVVLKIKDL